MKTNIKHIIKEMLLREEFDAGSAFNFIRQKEGRALPREYVLSVLKKGDISKLSIPEDLGDDKELWQIYKFVHAPETLTKEDLHVEDLNLAGCTSLQSLPKGLSVDGNLNLNRCTSLRELPEGLSVGWYLFLEVCTSLRELPQGLSVGWYVYFNSTDPIPQRFGVDKNAIRKYIREDLGGTVDNVIIYYEK